MIIDFHTHILPNIDDGSNSVLTSVKMLEEASNQGIGTIVCTPHFWPLKTTVPEFLQKREEKEGLLRSAIEGLSHPERIPKIIMGAECGWVKNISRYPGLEALCIEDTSFLLLELPLERWTDEIFEELYRLNTQRGIYPVIAHPNRYDRSIKEYNAIPAFAQLDCLFQIEANSVLWFKEKKFNLKLLSGPVPCVLGSDVHNDGPKAQRMSNTAEVIQKKLGTETMQKIQDVSGEVLKNTGLARLRSIWNKTVLIP